MKDTTTRLPHSRGFPHKESVHHDGRGIPGVVPQKLGPLRPAWPAKGGGAQQGDEEEQDDALDREKVENVDVVGEEEEEAWRRKRAMEKEKAENAEASESSKDNPSCALVELA